MLIQFTMGYLLLYISKMNVPINRIKTPCADKLL